jgi:hypothetical protein
VSHVPVSSLLEGSFIPDPYDFPFFLSSISFRKFSLILRAQTAGLGRYTAGKLDQQCFFRIPQKEKKNPAAEFTIYWADIP